jgi:hypothetical protein
MQSVKVALTILLVTCPFYLFSQKVKKKPANTSKLELVYKRLNINEFNANGTTRSSFIDYPYLIVNDAKPVEVDKRGNLMRRYYTKAPLSNEQIDLMIQQKRYGRAVLLTGLIGGGTYAMSGVFANADFGDHSKFYTRTIIGSAAILAAGYLWTVYGRRADRHLRSSVDIYNQKYYTPIIDSTAPVVKNYIIDSTGPTDKKYYKERLTYQQERNDPKNTSIWGVAITLASIEGSSMNSNMTGGAGLFYTYKSVVGISADYYIGYFDLITGSNKNNKPNRALDETSYGIPVNYQKPSLLDLQAKISIYSWDAAGFYDAYLGHERVHGRRVNKVGRIRTTNRKAITGRVGYMVDNRVLESSNGIGFVTNTTPYSYVYNGEPYTVYPDHLATSAAMLRSGIINVGVALSTFSDFKANLSEVRKKGREEQTSQTDIYIDLLYAQSQNLQDIVYYHMPNNTDEVIPQRIDISGTPLNKAGVRIGYSGKTLNRFFGWKYGVEAGIRPGLKTTESTGNAYVKLTIGVIFGGRTKSKK